MGPLLTAFERQCRDRRTAEALWSRGEGLRLSYGELGERVAARCRQLAAAGLGTPSEGRIVGLALANGAALCELFYALRRLGHSVALLDEDLAPDDRRALCRRLGISPVLVADPAGELGDGVGSEEMAADLSVWTPPGTEIVKVTSGSTGDPVGVCFTEQALVHGVEQIAEGMAMTAADRILLALPLSHSYGCDHGLLTLAVLGSTLILEPSFYPGALLRAAAESRATVLPLVPPLVHGLASCPWPADLPLRLPLSAGGRLSDEAAARFAAASGRPMHNFYGSTETGGISFEERPGEPAAAGTVGRPLPGVDLRLAEDSAVWVRSPALPVGFLGIAGEPPKEVATGDLGEWTADGRLRLVGRTSELLNIGGKRVSGRQLEDALRALPGVADAAVVAVVDKVRGERAVAFVVGAGEPLAAADLPRGLALRDLHQVDALPRTGRGKLDRRRLLQLATADEGTTS